MIRMTRFVCAALALFLATESAKADWASMCYGGYQPWWNIFAHRNRCQTHEEERLQRFWHDYYDALHRYYRGLEHIDWVAYYKNHGYRINSGGMCGGPGGCGPVQFAPVQVTPGMNWAAPGGASCAPPVGPMGFGPPVGGPIFAGSGPACGPMGCAAGPMPQGPPMMGYGPPAPMGYGPPPVAPAGYGMPGMPVQPAGYYYGQ